MGTGVRRFFSRRPAPPPREASDAELREFESASGSSVEADPGFREDLRRRLWAWLQSHRQGSARP
jgi:hypothetical protein